MLSFHLLAWQIPFTTANHQSRRGEHTTAHHNIISSPANWYRAHDETTNKHPIGSEEKREGNKGGEKEVK